MPQKRSKARSKQPLSLDRRAGSRISRRILSATVTGKATTGSSLPAKSATTGNGYLCAIERNQTGKYSVRVRAAYSRGAWTLPVYFLAGSFNGAMKKLQESLQVLQKYEDRLRFWGIERSDDPNMAGDLLQEFGLCLDRRMEFPSKAAQVSFPSEHPLRASTLAPMRRVLAHSMVQQRASVASPSSD